MHYSTATLLARACLTLLRSCLNFCESVLPSVTMMGATCRTLSTCGVLQLLLADDIDGAYFFSCMGTLAYLVESIRVRHLGDEWEWKLSSGCWDKSLRLRNVYIYFFYGIASIGLWQYEEYMGIYDHHGRVVRVEFW